MIITFPKRGVPRPPLPDGLVKGLLSEVNTADTIFHTRYSMDGTVEAKFHHNLLALMNMVFLLDSMKILSVEQQRFVSMFLSQAHTANLAIDNNADDPFADMADVMKQFDNFLGSYYGEPDESRFIRQK